MEGPLDPIAAVTHADPYPYYAELVAVRPFHRDEALGLWIAASAPAVRAVLTSWLCRVRPPAEPVPRALVGSPAADIFRQLVRMTDGPGQLQTKLAVAGHLASMNPGLIVQHGAAWGRRLCEELEPARDPGRIADYAFRLPVYVIASLLGFAPDRLPQLAAWTGDFVRGLAPAATPAELERAKTSAGLLIEAFRTLLNRSEVDGILANRIGYLSQAYEATAGLIGNTLVALGRHGDLRERVAATRGFLGAVIREVVRYDPPVQNTRRFLAAIGTVADQELKEGEAVLVVLAAANRDPAANSQPAAFDPFRRDREAFTFGLGLHACPGEMMASVIAEAGVEQLLAAGVAPERLVGAVRYRPSANTRIPLFGPSSAS